MRVKWIIRSQFLRPMAMDEVHRLNGNGLPANVGPEFKL